MTSKLLRTLWIALASAALAPAAVAQPAPAAPVDDPRVEIAKRIPGAKPEELRPTPIPNIYEMT